MSETLTKLGGYVVNGQPELTTDNTLSGTGLPDSPLGVTTDYSAGTNIDITNNVISGKDWSNEIESAVSSKLDTTAFSDVSGTFLTAHQSLEGYATENFVTGITDNKLDTTAYSETSGTFMPVSAIQYVTTSAEATGSNILYIVTGSN